MSCIWQAYAPGPGNNPTTASPGGNPAPAPGTTPTSPTTPAPTLCMPAGASCNASNFLNCCSQYCLGTAVCATVAPTPFPTQYPTAKPTQSPTPSPTKVPTTASPTLSPTPVPWDGNPFVTVTLMFPDANDAGWSPESLLGNVTEGIIEYLDATGSRIRVKNQTLSLITIEILAPGYDAAYRYVDLLSRRTSPEQPQVADQSIIFGNRTQLGDLLFSISAVASSSPTSSPLFTSRPTPTPVVKASSDNHAGVIAGVVVGLGGGLFLLLLLLWCRMKKQQSQPQQQRTRKDGITFEKTKPTTTGGPKKKEVKVNV
jgi:hypothetical protein